MSQKSTPSQTAEQHVREIRRRTRKQYSSEEKVRIVLSGLRGEHSIAELCRREGIAESMYYAWSKDFLEAVSWPPFPWTSICRERTEDGCFQDVEKSAARSG